MIALSSTIIDLLPFTMVRSNGAWMLSTFLWFQLLIITVQFLKKNIPLSVFWLF